MYLIGTDEAGYGPNLGPLVISATVWHVEDEDRAAETCLWDRLRRVIVSRPADAGTGRVAMADSKKLYKPGHGLALLERGVLAALALAGHWPKTCSELWSRLDPESVAERTALPWHEQYDHPLPVEVDEDDLPALVPVLCEGLAEQGVRLLAVRSRAVFPGEFNRLLAEHGNKATALSTLSLRLVREVLAPHDDEPVRIVCDKHGGRNRYGSLLQRHFPEHLVQVHCEGRAQSVYHWGPTERPVEICFRTGGEAFLPAALASMTSKYLRELAMRALNDYWCGRVEDLRPTAGYPLDARRFKAEIEPVQQQLGIEDRVLWRSR